MAVELLLILASGNRAMAPVSYVYILLFIINQSPSLCPLQSL